MMSIITRFISNCGRLEKLNDYQYFLFILLSTLILFGKLVFIENFFFDDAIHLDLARDLSFSLDLFKNQQFVFLFFVKLLDMLTVKQLALHFFIILLHACNGILLFRILTNRLKMLKATSITLAIIFILHPVVIESVAWWSSLKGVLSLFFAMMALEVLSIKGYKKHIFFLICIFLSYYSKPILLSYLGLYALLFRGYITLENAERILSKYYLFVIFVFYLTFLQLSYQLNLNVNHLVIAIFSILVVSLLVYVIVYKHFFLKRNDLRSVTIIGLGLIAALSYSYDKFKIKFNLVLMSIWHYFSKIFWDFSYSYDYGLKEANYESIDTTLIPFIVLFGIIYTIFKLRSKNGILLFVAILFSLLPYIGVSETLFRSTSIVADRYSYLLLFVIVIVIGFVAKEKNQESKILILLFGIWPLVAVNQEYVRKWSGEPRGQLYLEHSIEYNPLAFSSYIALGNHYREYGYFDMAYDLYRDGLTINMQVSELQRSFFKTAVDSGKCKDAMSIYSILNYEGMKLISPNNYKYIGICKFYLKDYSGTVRSLKLYPMYQEDFITNSIHSIAAEKMKNGEDVIIDNKKYKKIFVDE